MTNIPPSGPDQFNAVQIDVEELQRRRLPESPEYPKFIEFFTDIYIGGPGTFAGSQLITFAPAVFTVEPFPSVSKKGSSSTTLRWSATSFVTSGGLWTAATIEFTLSQPSAGWLLVNFKGEGRV